MSYGANSPPANGVRAGCTGSREELCLSRPRAEAEFIERLKRGGALSNSSASVRGNLRFAIPANRKQREARDRRRRRSCEPFKVSVDSRRSRFETWIYRIAINQAGIAGGGGADDVGIRQFRLNQPTGPMIGLWRQRWQNLRRTRQETLARERELALRTALHRLVGHIARP